MAITYINKMKLLENNFQLSEIQFNAYLEESDFGNNILLQHLYEKHNSKCVQYLTKSLSINECDAYNYVMEAILYFWEKIQAKKIKYGNLSYLLTKIAIQVYLKTIKNERKLDLNLLTNISHYENNEHCIDCIKIAISKLNPDELNLLKDYYVEKKSFVDIAELSKVKETTLRKRKQRAVMNLKREFHKLYEPEPHFINSMI